MSDRTIEQVPEECARLYQCGLEALEKRELDSAIASFITALEKEPGFVACREALRRAQLGAAEKKPGFWTNIFQPVRLSPSLTAGQILLHIRPLKTISIAERVLNRDHENSTAHKLLAKAALAVDLPRTAVLSLEALVNEHPGHRALKMELAGALARSGDTSTAATLYGQLLKDDPHDGKVLRALQKIPAQPAAQEEASPANGHLLDRPVVSPPGPAFQPQPRPAPAISADDATIKRLEPMVAHCKKNTTILKTLAEAYGRKMMFDKSLSLYQRALKIRGGKNAAIEAAIEETTLKILEQELKQLDPQSPEYAAKRERLQNQRLDYQWQAMEECR